MTMMMMQRIIESTQKPPECSGKPESPQHMFLPAKRIPSEDDDKSSETDDEELNVDVETEDALCPVDLTRRQRDEFPASLTDPGEEQMNALSADRSESVCSDVSRSGSPREQSPSVVVPHQNRRLAFSVENILDPNKFTGRQAGYGDGICCWKPHPESMGSPEYDGSETGWSQRECKTVYLFSFYGT